jgi:hypothetical protein
MSLRAFETGLHKIESSLDRKQIYNIMYDLIKSGKIAGSRVLKIIINNLEHETAVDVLQDILTSVVPAILGKFLQPDVFEIRNTQMFDLALKIMQSGTFNKFASAMETLLTSAIGFSESESSAKLVYKWFVTGKVTDSAGNLIEGTDINVEVRHTMVRKIFSSKAIPGEHKKECFASLAKLD